jgi:serine/threonine protein kinase
MSSEQARGDVREIDARTDIWGLGATMFTLLTGRYLHATSPPRNLVVATATEQARPVLSMEPGMYPPLAAIIDRAVRMNKEERWPNVRAMLAELETIAPIASEIRALTPTAPDNDPSMTTAPSSLMSWSHAVTWLRRAELRSNRRLAGIALGTATAAVGVAMFWARGSAPPSSDEAAAKGSSRSAVRAESSAVSLPPAPSQASSVALVETAQRRDDSLPLKRPPAQKARRSTPVVAELPGVAPSAASAKTNESGLSVPDEVLDRRE